MNRKWCFWKSERVAGFVKQKKVKIPLWMILCLTLFYNLFANYNQPTEIGVARNHITGEMWIQEGGGLFVSPPWVWVSRIDTRPVRVAVESAGRGYSAKLVQFDKRHWREFVDLEGWRYYWLANRISFNFGHEEEYRGMRNILRGYAYSPRQYSFLIVHEEYEARQ